MQSAGSWVGKVGKVSVWAIAQTAGRIVAEDRSRDFDTDTLVLTTY